MSWPLVNLGSVVSVKGGKRLPANSEYATEATDHPYLRVCDFGEYGIDCSKLKYIASETHRKISRYTISDEDVYISIAGTIGVVGVIPPSLSGANLTENAAKIVIKDKKTIDKNYLVKYLSGPGKTQIENLTKSTSQPKLALFRIEEIEIPLPPLEEQKRIAAILDKADAIRRKRQQAIKLADDFLRSVFLEMFGDPVTNPKGWELQQIGSFCSLQGGFAFKSSEYTAAGVPLIKITNVHFEDVDWDDVSYLPDVMLSEKSDFSLKVGDLVMAMTRPIIKSLDAVKIIEIKESDIPSLLNQRVGRFRGYGKVVTKEFFKYFLYSEYFKSEVEKLCSVALQPNVSSKQIESIFCYLPPRDIQYEFSKMVSCVSKMLPKLKVASQKKLFEALSQKAFSGQL